MKKSTIGMITGGIVGGAFIAAGIVVGVFNGFSADSTLFQSGVLEANQTYTAAEVTDISIEAEAAEVTVRTAETEAVTVAYYDGEKIDVQIDESGGLLTIQQTIVFGMFVNCGGEITVTLPEGAGGYDVKIVLDAGSVTLNGLTAAEVKADVDAGEIILQDTACDRAVVSVDAGQIVLDDCTAVSLSAAVDSGYLEGKKVTADEMQLSVDIGSIQMSVSGTKSEYTLRGSVSLGSCNFSDAVGTTGKSVTASVDVGDITITFSDE